MTHSLPTRRLPERPDLDQLTGKSGFAKVTFKGLRASLRNGGGGCIK